METSPISAAATWSPSTDAASYTPSADNSNFQRVLQQMDPAGDGVSSRVSQKVTPPVTPKVDNQSSPTVTTTLSTSAGQSASQRVSPGVTSNISKGISPATGAPPDGSRPSISSLTASSKGKTKSKEKASVLAASKANGEQPGVANLPARSSLTARQEAKQQIAAKGFNAPEPKEDHANSAATTGTAIAVVVPVAPDVLSNPSLSADSHTTSLDSTPADATPRTAPGSSGISSNPDAPATAADSSAAAKPHALHPTAVASNAASNATQQAALPAVESADATIGAAYGAALLSRASQALLNSHPALAPETFPNPNSAPSHSTPRTGTSSEPTTRSRPQATAASANSSASPEKANGTPAAILHDSSLSAAAPASAHSSSVQAVAASLSATPASTAADSAQSATQLATQSAAQSATQSATQSAAVVFAQPSVAQSSPAPAQAQVQSNAIPDPPRMVDSGQLRMTPNSSELKISVQLPELGKVEVRAVTARDVTTAHLTTFRHDALPVLAADRTGLEQMLKSRDVVLGSFDSHTQGQSAGQQRQQSFQPFAPILWWRHIHCCHGNSLRHRRSQRFQPRSRITPASAFAFRCKENECKEPHSRSRLKENDTT